MWTIIAAAQDDRWMACLERLGRHDVYHLPAYHRAYEVEAGTEAAVEALAYVAEIDGEMLFHPVMLRPIVRVGDQVAPPGLCDTETVYGYSGPLSSSADTGFLARAWAGYGAWCAQRGVVCEFTRFNPLLGNHVPVAPGRETWRDRQTVAIDLGAGDDALWQGYAGAHRNSIRKAVKSGLVCRHAAPEADLEAFRHIYQETMRGLGAEASYFLSQDHFARLRRGLGPRLRLFMVSAGGADIAGALFLVHGETLHYHLAGSLASHRHLAPNNLLVHEAARWAIAQGLKTFHLGGGRGPEPEDSLFRFKARFSRRREDMWFGKQVFDPAAYETLVALWLRQFKGARPPKYLQIYRRGLAG